MFLAFYFLFSFIFLVSSETKLKFEGDAVEFGCQSDRVKEVIWILPNSKILLGKNLSSGNDYRILPNGTLVVNHLKSTENGKYVCIESNQDQQIILDEHLIPYVIVRKNHLHSLYIALGVSGGFLLSALGLYLISEFKWRDEKEIMDNDDRDEFRYYQPADRRRIDDDATNPVRFYVNNIQISDTHL